MSSTQRRNPQNTAGSPEGRKKAPSAKSRMIGIAAVCLALIAVVCVAAAVGKKQAAGKEPGSTHTPSIPSALSDGDLSPQTSHKQENPETTVFPSAPQQKPADSPDRNPSVPESSAPQESPETSAPQTQTTVIQTSAPEPPTEEPPVPQTTLPETTAAQTGSTLVFSVLSDEQAADRISSLSAGFDSADLTGCELIFSESLNQRVLSPEGDVISARVYCFTDDVETPERFFSEYCLSHTYSGDFYMVFLTKEQAVRMQSASFSETGIFVFLAS